MSSANEEESEERKLKKKKKKPQQVELVQYQKPEIYELVEEHEEIGGGHGHGGLHHGLGHHGFGGLHKKKYGRSIGGLFRAVGGIRYSFWLWFLFKH